MSNFRRFDDFSNGGHGGNNGNGGHGGNNGNGGYGGTNGNSPWETEDYRRPRETPGSRWGGPPPAQPGQGRPFSGTPVPSAIPPSRNGGADRGVGGRTTFGGGSGAAGVKEATFDEIKRKVQSALINELNPAAESSHPDQVERALEEQFNRVLSEQGHTLSRNDRQQLLAGIKAEILGYGPIDLLLHDDSVTEVMVNGPQQVYVEQNGRLYSTDIKFRDDEHVMHIIERIISPLGRRCDEASPYVDARLPDGSRVNAVIPPISLVGPVLTIRKFAKIPLQPDDLVKLGTLTPGMVEFLKACVQVKLNIVVSGGTGSGKTTFLNVLSGFIPDGERIITIEDAAELQLRQTHVLRLESRPANIEGKGRISIRDLVANALRMRPDRIIVGECRREEALDMLQAMNTGHEGSMTTIHSNSPRDTLRRLETLVTMGETQIPLKAIREQISSAIHLIVHQERMSDGSRKITSITEVLGMEGGEIINSQQLFVFEQTGLESGRVVGRLRTTGARPSFADRFELANIHLHPSILGAGPR
jgi:pilus assembly protein CpaF